jgi:hypothetical protein
MARTGRWLIGAVVAAGVLGGVLVSGGDTARAQGNVNVAQFPAQGQDPPYNPATLGVPTTPDITVTQGRADATSPVVGQFPQAFMASQPAAPLNR